MRELSEIMQGFPEVDISMRGMPLAPKEAVTPIWLFTGAPECTASTCSAS